MMSSTDVATLARHLHESRGSRAIAEAAQKAQAFEQAGDQAQAKDWRRVQQTLLELRGARET
jgi:hypothetical protein